jgi:MoxR-like ATPase
MDIEQKAGEFRKNFDVLATEIGKVIVGHGEVIRHVLVAVVAGGHVLLEGVPGIGKTMLVRTLSAAVDLRFSRIQFTPDLMPADIIGTNVVVEDREGRKSFEFQKGPVFGNVILADEINRATPKTQSALLEAMQEQTVTVAGTRHLLPQPFFVLATQNPIEMEGTYPLPEAQLDRFLFKVEVKTPDLGGMVDILRRTTEETEPEAGVVLKGEEILAMRRLAREVPAATPVLEYAGRLVLATHPERDEALEIARKYVRYGASPRAAQALILGAKVMALTDSRYNASFEDVRKVAFASLRHRLVMNFEGEAEGVRPDHVIEKLLEEVPRAPKEVEKLLRG